MSEEKVFCTGGGCTAKLGVVRFSFGWFNTEQETDAAIQAVRELAQDSQEA